MQAMEEIVQSLLVEGHFHLDTRFGGRIAVCYACDESFEVELALL